MESLEFLHLPNMIDVYYGEIIGVDVNEIEVNGIKEGKVELEFTDTFN